MSLALDFLKEYLSRPDQTQADFALCAGMTPPNVSDLLKGDVLISDRNLSKLLRGIRTEKDRHDFLTAYLRDRVPSDYAEIITVHLKAPIPSDRRLMEQGEEETLDHQIVQAFASLPSDLYRKRVIRFLSHLKKDAGLRDLFTRTVAYLEEDDLGSPLSLEESSSTYSAERIVDEENARRGAKPKAGGTGRAAPGSSKRTRS